jgi:hypothetical protein
VLRLIHETRLSLFVQHITYLSLSPGIILRTILLPKPFVDIEADTFYPSTVASEVMEGLYN